MAELSAQYVSGISDLIHRRLTPALVDPDYFNATFHAATSDSSNFDVFPISSDILTHWSRPIDIFFNQKEAYFKVIVKIPAQHTKRSCAMFRLQPTPFSVSE